MSDKTKIDREKEKLLNDSTERRRDLQYRHLRDYVYGKVTGRQCIENILEAEKIIFFDRRPNGR